MPSGENAGARGAEILGEIIGYGAVTDTHHLTQPHPEGDAAFAAMTAACRQAGLSPRDVDYVNAHGTSTPVGDPSEIRVIKRALGDALRQVSDLKTKDLLDRRYERLQAYGRFSDTKSH